MQKGKHKPRIALDVTQQERRHFLRNTMFLLTAFLFVPLLALNVIAFGISYQQTKGVIEEVARSAATQWDVETGADPGDSAPEVEEPIGETDERPVREKSIDAIKNGVDYFVCSLNFDGSIYGYTRDIPYSVTQLEDLVRDTLDHQKSSGITGHFQFFIQPAGAGYILVLADCTAQWRMLRIIMITSVSAFVVMAVAAFFIVRHITNRAFQPLQDALAQQRQFISDASHELKTPLAIMQMNADILTSEVGADNKHLRYFQEQISRMNRLVLGMLTLSRLEKGEVFENVSFSLSNVVETTTLAFEAPIFEQGKTLETHIAPDVVWIGDQEKTAQLIEILMENALKYCDDKGLIRVTLEGGKNKHLEVYNTGNGLTSEEITHIFDRFYRADASRHTNSQVSFGIGLSIAKRIADGEKLKIFVTSEPGKWVSFDVTFPH